MDKWKSTTKMTILAILCTLVASILVYQLNVPNPVIVLVILMIFFETLAGWGPGAASGIIITFYALFYFSTYHRFQHYTETAGYKCIVVMISLLIIYIMVGKLKQYADRIYRHMMDMNHSLLEVNEELENISNRDALTGIYNRRGGEKMLVRYIEGKDGRPKGLNSAPKKQAILAVLDVDNFKHFNDVYGHAVGDRVLAHVVKEMKDTFPKDTELIRHGGDEFLILIKNENRRQMEALLKAFAGCNFQFDYHGETVSFHISCGYALYPEQAVTVAELFAKADDALYFVKLNGKRRAVCYDDSMNQDTRSQFRFSLMDIFAGLPVSIIIYRADETEKILLATQSAVELFGCQNWQDFLDYTGGTFRQLVHPDDIERVEQSIAKQIVSNDKQMDSVEYRIIAKNNIIKKIHDIGRMVTHPQLGKLFYVVLYDKESLEI